MKSKQLTPPTQPPHTTVQTPVARATLEKYGKLCAATSPPRKYVGLPPCCRNPPQPAASPGSLGARMQPTPQLPQHPREDHATPDKYVIKSRRSPLQERVCAAPGKYGSAPAVTRPQGSGTGLDKYGNLPPRPQPRRPGTHMAPPPEPVGLLRSAAVASVAAAAQQPREAGRSNSPTTWLAEKAGLRALRPPGREKEPGGSGFGSRTPRRARHPKLPGPRPQPFPFQDRPRPQAGNSSLFLTSLILKPRWPGQAHGLAPRAQEAGCGGAGGISGGGGVKAGGCGACRSRVSWVADSHRRGRIATARTHRVAKASPTPPRTLWPGLCHQGARGHGRSDTPTVPVFSELDPFRSSQDTPQKSHQ